MTTEIKQKQFFAKLSPICFFSLLALQGISVAQANIVSAPGGPSLSGGSTQGSTVVNINAPGLGGVSHNIYNQFDVKSEGVVLNNSAQNSTTQLAGAINGNQNLANRGPASVILNEVNSSKASQLNGMIEVAGQNAQVIIANPSGITCNGCGFINANRATLTTGKPLVAGGKLIDYTVKKGKITITGDGMQSSSANYTDLIAQSVVINANLQAKDLQITTGLNRVNADNTVATPLSTSSSSGFALDVSSLGGMYADKITMIGTQEGVGVNNAGTIAASVGNIAINSRGRVTNSGAMVAGKDIDIVSATRSGNTTVTNTGYVEAGGDVSIKSAYVKNNKGGVITASDNVNINSSVKSSQMGIDNTDGIILAGKSATISAKDSAFKNTNGLLSSVDDVVIDTKYNVNNSLGRISSSFGGVTITSHGAADIIQNNNGTIEANCCINLTAGRVENNRGIIQTKSDVVINSTYGLFNDNGVIQAEGDVKINANDVRNNSGKIMAMENMDIKTKYLTNHAYTNPLNEYGIFSGGDMTISSSSSFQNAYGVIAANGNLEIAPTYGINNKLGHIESGKDLLITLTDLYNYKGNIIAGENATITASRIDNGSSLDRNSLGNIQANDTLSINLKRGVLSSGQFVNGDLYNYGTMMGKNKLVINSEAGVVHNRGNMISDNPIEIHDNAKK
ncbi:two-partner secretion domain-containing protein [Serratia fonticola]